jgi:hypothetical protein
MAKKQEDPKPKKTVNKNIVSVGRLKTVRDSLNNKASEKSASARYIMFNGIKTDKKKDELKMYQSSSASDSQRAKKYDGMIKKVTAKKK